LSTCEILVPHAVDAALPTAVARFAARMLVGLDHDLDELLDDATRTVCTVLRVECCGIVQLDEGGDVERVCAGHPPDRGSGAERVEFPLPALPRGLLVASHDVAARPWGAAELEFLSAVAELLDRAIERRKLHEELRGRALHDALTGLPNRVLLMDRLAHALAGRRRPDVDVALLYIDLDEFKPVNDSLGHPAGDQLLRQFARRLLVVLRPSDTLARIGGDEFVMLANDVRATDGTRSIAGRILAEAAKPFDLDAGVARITASVGVAIAGPSDTPDTLLSAADDALYVAKRAGRATHRVAAR